MTPKRSQFASIILLLAVAFLATAAFSVGYHEDPGFCSVYEV